MATEKEQIWLSEYFKCWNATEAARRAGYKWPDKQGQEKKAKFIDEIKAEVEARAMSADEALLELGDIARLDIGDFLEFKDGIKAPYLDLKKAKDAGLLKLVKKLKYNAQGFLEFELYDKQAALVQIGKWQGLMDKTQNFNVDLTQLTTEQLERIAKGEDVYSVIASPNPGSR